MKLQILMQDEDKIEGFTSVKLPELPSAAPNIADNECEVIVATKILNLLQQEQIEGFVTMLTTKLRRGGTLVLSGIEPKVLCKMISNDTIRVETLNNVVAQCNSTFPLKDCLSLLSGKGLQIKNAAIQGVEYEIQAQRN
jgi:hypothetical protein